MAHWIVKKNYTGNIRCTCSECKYTYVDAGEYYDYLYNSLICPNCKAKLTDKTEFVNTAKLQDMSQYHIDRDKLCEIVKETIGYDTLMDVFCYGEFNQSDEFAWFRNYGDEFYIIHLPSGMMINWYKHLGRTNTCSQSNRTIEDYYEFFKRFKMDLEYWAESKNIKLG